MDAVKTTVGSASAGAGRADVGGGGGGEDGAEHAAAAVMAQSWFPDDVQQLRMLVVTDIHCAFDNIRRLSEYVARERLDVDLVVCCGDFLLMEAEDNYRDADDGGGIARHEGDVTSILQLLAEIGGGKVAYIPGNHDPISMFGGQAAVTPYYRNECAATKDVIAACERSGGANRDTRFPADVGCFVRDSRTGDYVRSLPRLTPVSCALHGSVIRLAPGLVLGGFGGSVTAHFPDASVCWQGFPYTEADMERGMEELLGLRQPQAVWDDAVTALCKVPVASRTTNRYMTSRAVGMAVEDTERMVLLTHCGPAPSSTTLDQEKFSGAQSPVSTGSTALGKLLRTEKCQEQVLLNVHGHTHNAPGVGRHGSMPVFNCGALKNGAFGIVTLRRDLVTQQWRVAGLDMRQLVNQREERVVPPPPGVAKAKK